MEQNQSQTSGGGLALFASGDNRIAPVTANSTWVGNVALGYGGAIYAYGTTPEIRDTTIVGNTAFSVGGGIFADVETLDDETMTLDHCLLSHNLGLNLVHSGDVSRINVTCSNAYTPAANAYNHTLRDADGNLLVADEDGEGGFLNLRPDFVNLDIDDIRNGNLTALDLHLLPSSALRLGTPLECQTSETDEIGIYGGADADQTYYSDRDADGMLDGWEILMGLDPSLDDADFDADNDGASNWSEANRGTDPADADSDDDGDSDGDEISADAVQNLARDWYLGLNGARTASVPGDFASIQKAIDAVVERGEITLTENSYSEGLIVNAKALTLHSNDPTPSVETSTPISYHGGSVIRAIQSDLILSGILLALGIGSTSLEDGSLRGGGLFLFSSTAILEFSVIDGNSANFGGGVYSFYSDLTLNSCTVSDNEASSDGAGIHFGAGTASVVGSGISGNHAARYGGGFYNFSGYTTIDASSFYKNSADVAGGGIYAGPGSTTLGNSTVVDDNGAPAGAGIYADGGMLNISSSSVTNNSTDSSSDGIADGNGGGLYLSLGTASLDDVLFSTNYALLGGGIYASWATLSVAASSIQENSAMGGAGLYVTEMALTVADSNVADNVGTDSESSEGAGVFALLSTVDLQRLLIQNNLSPFYGGVNLSQCAGTFLDSIVEGNGLIDTAGTGLGGGVAVHDSGADLLLSGLTLRDNEAWQGGGLYLLWSSSTIEHTTLQANYADHGGGVLLQNSSPTFNHCDFSGNGANAIQIEANSGGGAAYLTLSYCSIQNNVGYRSGTALRMDDGGAKLSHCVITGNTSTNTVNTGGIYIVGAADSLTLENSIVAYNSPYNLTSDAAWAPTLTNTNVYNPAGCESESPDILLQTDYRFEPGFLGYSTDDAITCTDGSTHVVPADFHLAADSLMVNAGNSAVHGVDTDNTLPDLGIYGGSDGDLWDRDSDGFPDYFWPGGYSAVPAGIRASDYDCDDTRNSSHPGASESANGFDEDCSGTADD